MVFCKNVRTSVLFVQKCVKKCVFFIPYSISRKWARGPGQGGKTEYRIQETEDGSQKAEGGRQHGLKAILPSLRGLTTNSTN